MKILEQNKVEQLLQIIQNKSGKRIVHFSHGSHIFTKALSKLCKKYGHDYYLYCTKEVFYAKSMTKYAGQSHMHIIKFDLERTTYEEKECEYDYLISTLDLQKENTGTFLKKCDPLLKKEGEIILLISKTKPPQIEDFSTLLQSHNYVSTRSRDDLFENYDTIVAKRTHT